jgi:ribose transport system permease protein
MKISKFKNPVIIAFGCSIGLVLIGGLYFPEFLTITYLLKQLHMASFLGVVASGAMIVILMGHIDLSVPWTLTVTAIVSCAVAGGELGETWKFLAIPAGLLTGALIGLCNGLGVAYLRIHSMIWTLGMNVIILGLSVFYTGGFQPPGVPSGLMRLFGIGKLFNIPVSIFLWLFLALIIVFLLRRTQFGRYIYALGNSEKVTYLSGVKTNHVLILAFIVAGMCSSTAGMMVAGYANLAYQGMGDVYLLPGIAAVVIGGTNILGGSGNYLGTVAGAILITLISSMLSVMQMPEAGRQVIYGSVIIIMLLTYGRVQKVQA